VANLITIPGLVHVRIDVGHIFRHRADEAAMSTPEGDLHAVVHRQGALSDRVEPDEFSVRWWVIAARDAGVVGRDCVARSPRIGRSGAPGLIAAVWRPPAQGRRLSGASAAPLDDGSAAGELAVAMVGRSIPLRRGRGVELSRRPSRQEWAMQTGSGCHPCLQRAGDVARSAR